MSSYLKPQSPLYHKTEDAYFYPLTTVDQVVLEDGSRLNSELSKHLVIDIKNANEAEPNGINADTLGGYAADEYARKEDLENIDTDLLSENVKNKIMYSKSRNLFINMGVTQTRNGITFTVNDDKSITINGTATDTAGIVLFGNIEGPDEKSINVPKDSVLTGIPDIEGLWLCISDYVNQLYIYNKKYEVNTTSFPIINDFLKEQDMVISNAFLYVDKGTTFNNLTVYPMILAPGNTDMTYEPYYNNLMDISTKTMHAVNKFLLWHNASPLSEFAAKSAYFGGTERHYDYYEIYYIGYAYSTDTQIFIVKDFCSKEYSSKAFTIYDDKTFGFRTATQELSNNGLVVSIKFSEGKYLSLSGTISTDNKVLIPYKIYGVWGDNQ